MKETLEKSYLAIEKVIECLKEAAKKAKKSGDRAAERNLGEYEVADFENMLRNYKFHYDYIVQPRFAKYFENTEGENKG